jgi:hypothetical protein
LDESDGPPKIPNPAKPNADPLAPLLRLRRVGCYDVPGTVGNSQRHPLLQAPKRKNAWLAFILMFARDQLTFE